MPGDAAAPDLSFVVLTWNSAATIAECLQSIVETCDREHLSREVFVVDNGSTDGTPAILRGFAATPGLTVVSLSQNGGTTRPRNLALARCAGEVVCLLDSDAALREGSVRGVVERLRAARGLGIVAPRLLLPDGDVQDSARRFPSVPGKLGRAVGAVTRVRLAPPDLYPGFPFQSATPIDYAMSACWFFRRALLDDIGYLDERIFYSPEDVDFCLRCWQAGREVVWDPSVTVLHRATKLTHRKVISRIAVSHLCGLAYYFVKHRYWRRPDVGPGR
ncbi:MAG TPA: glycosyltransferase [Polyangia bacterium]|jgi:hypothetical protein